MTSPLLPVPAQAPVAPWRGWIRTLLAIGLMVLAAALWRWTPLKDLLKADAIADWVRPHRLAWYAFPVTVAVYVVFGFVMVPVLAMILLTGMIFGPWLGSGYALAGCLASASVSFCVGRRLGRETVERLVGERARRIHRALRNNGILAVFLLRKVPAPYTLVNVVVGASGIRYVDFLVGTLLGMGSMIILLAAFGHHFLEALRDPSPGSVVLAVALFLSPIVLALTIDRLLRRRRKAA